jgi:nitroimidazol reductase NimA-like FMN-containing flavoprotein (pyridoxamine 5'-phosphate oxidase superfamily)
MNGCYWELSREESRKILCENSFGHLALVNKDLPYLLPVYYQPVLKDDIITIFLYSNLCGKKIDIIKENQNFALEVDTEGRRNYCSVIVSGKITKMEKCEKEKIFKLTLEPNEIFGRSYSIFN